MSKQKKVSGSWASIGRDMCALGSEASLVVPLRLLRVMSGGTAAREELHLMISEKVDAHGEWARAVMSGSMGKSPRALASGTVRFYLPFVRANRKRLARLAK